MKRGGMGVACARNFLYVSWAVRIQSVHFDWH
jgi:hypothetical protein